MAQRPFVSVVVLLRHRQHDLDEVLQAIELQWPDVSSLECILVGENVSNALGLRSFQRKSTLTLRFVDIQHSLGWAVGVNAACSIALGDLFLFLGSESTPGSGWLQAYVDIFEVGVAEVLVGFPRYLPGSAQSDVSSNPSKAGCGPVGCAKDGWCRRASPEGACIFCERNYCGEAISFGNSLGGYRSRPNGQVFQLSNSAVSRRLWNELCGLSPLLMQDYDLDFGMRCLQQGFNITVAASAVTYLRRSPRMEYPGGQARDRQGLIYRHPSRDLVMSVVPETTSFANVSSARAESSLYCCETARPQQRAALPQWDTYIAEMDPAVIGGSFEYSLSQMANYLVDTSGAERDLILEYLSDAIRKGLVFRQAAGETYLDVCYTTNWLRTRTRFHQEWLRNASYTLNELFMKGGIRTDQTERAISCSGKYRLGLREGTELPFELCTLNISIPVEHRMQQVIRVKLVPEGVEQFTVRRGGSLLHIPAKLLSDGREVGYDFECVVSEDKTRSTDVLLQGDGTASVLQEEIETGFTFPAPYRRKCMALLTHILGTDSSSADRDVKRIFEWIVENLDYANNPLPDYAVLDTGFGTCVQLTRLFVNLVRLRGLSAREQCGALMTQKKTGGGVQTIAYGYSPFAHTWADVLSEECRWYPVDLVAIGYGRWQLNSENVDEATRASMDVNSRTVLDYFCGSLDPYRVYTDGFANKIGPISFTNTSRTRKVPDKWVSCVSHALVCTLAPAR